MKETPCKNKSARNIKAALTNTKYPNVPTSNVTSNEKIDTIK